MTLAELEDAKEALRKTVEDNKKLMPIDKEDVDFFVSQQVSMWKRKGREVTLENEKSLINYLESYLFVRHDHDGYAIIDDEPFDNTWYTNNPP